MLHRSLLPSDRAGRFVQIFVRSCAAALAVCFAFSLVGCAGTPEQEPLQVETGRLAGVTHDGLVRMSGSELEGVWVRPDVDVSRYDRLLIGEVRLSYKRPPTSRRGSSSPGNFPLAQSQIERLQQMLREALADEIRKSQRWSLAEEPGEGVLLIEPRLLDLVVRVPPNQDPTERTYTTSAGQVTLVLELRDSLTGQILARVADRSEVRRPGAGSQQLYWSNSVSNTSAVRTIFRRWARIFVARLDTARRLSAASEARPGDAAGEATP
jgi:hypothetical protein